MISKRRLRKFTVSDYDLVCGLEAQSKSSPHHVFIILGDIKEYEEKIKKYAEEYASGYRKSNSPRKTQ